jgi:sugar phosphate isomerase/epimerase
MKVVIGSGLAAALLLGGAAWIASAAPAERKPLAGEQIGFRLALQCWTVNKKTAFEAIDHAASLGIRYVELIPNQKMKPDSTAKIGPGMTEEAMAELKKKLEEAGVKALNYGVGGCGRGDFEFAKKLGLETLVAEPKPEDVVKIDKLCEEFGINLALHNHPKPSTYWDPETVLKATQGCSKRVGACADTGHWMRSGLNPVECLKKLEGRIISLHFKDLSEKKSDVPFGTGTCDVKAMLAELKRQGFKGIFSIEYEVWDAQQTENIQKCVNAFEQICGELAGAK